jgi:hypothetical protein
MTAHLLALSGPEIKDESDWFVQVGGAMAPARRPFGRMVRAKK